MKNTEPEKKEAPFESLIRAEESAALARFRAGDFEAEVRKRIGRTRRAEPECTLGRILTRPVWVAAAGGILLIAVGFAILRRPAPKPDLARAIEGILRLAPNIEALEAGSWAQIRGSESAAAAPDARNLAALIVGGMSSAAIRSAAPSAEVSRRFRESRPLSLKEIYRIVSVDKSIERVLMLVS